MRVLPYRNDGVGFAGNQLGVPYRIFAMKRKGMVELFINPRITKFYGKKFKHYEGCLSIPGKSYEVERYKELDIEYRDKTFKKVVERLDGMSAIIVQHEVDHLDGILISNKGSVE